MFYNIQCYGLSVFYYICFLFITSFVSLYCLLLLNMYNKALFNKWILNFLLTKKKYNYILIVIKVAELEFYHIHKLCLSIYEKHVSP